MTALDWLTNPAHPRTAVALQASCIVCKARPGDPCRNICGGEMNGRVVHFARLP